jgi:hypothetical protein
MIVVPLDMGPAAFRCPACNALYVVDPLKTESVECGIGFSRLECSGHIIEVFHGDMAQRLYTDWLEAEDFFTPKVGGLRRVFVARLQIPPGN